MVAQTTINEHLRPLDDALGKDLARLQRSAETGYGDDQLAMSILSGAGLRGVPKDAEASDRWRRVSQIGKVHIGSGVYVPFVTAARLQALDLCLAEIERPRTGQPVCGDTEQDDQRRRDNWARAVANAASVPAPSQ